MGKLAEEERETREREARWNDEFCRPQRRWREAEGSHRGEEKGGRERPVV